MVPVRFLGKRPVEGLGIRLSEYFRKVESHRNKDGQKFTSIKQAVRRGPWYFDQVFCWNGIEQGMQVNYKLLELSVDIHSKVHFLLMFLFQDIQVGKS